MKLFQLLTLEALNIESQENIMLTWNVMNVAFHCIIAIS